jgi:putative endonuclease
VKDLVKPQPELKKKILTVNQKKLNNFFVGFVGERLACNFLKKKNYKILGINLRVKNNEIDIVALDNPKNELVFIEVKTRSSIQFGTPALAVSNKKLQSITLVAKKYLRQHHCNLDYRFDIIAISYLKQRGIKPKPKIEHFENISWP